MLSFNEWLSSGSRAGNLTGVGHLVRVEREREERRKAARELLLKLQEQHPSLKDL